MKKYKIIENYLDDNLTTKSSRKNYRWGITKFFKIIDKDPETYFKENKLYDEYYNDMTTFIKALSKYAPLSIHLAISSVKSFLIEHDMEFKQKDLRKFAKRCNGRHAISDDRIPTSEELRLILANADLRLKTLYLFMVSSGMRRGELCQLTLDDINLDTIPTRVVIRASYTKSKMKRIVFISNEATECLKEWLRHREQYIMDSVARVNKQGMIHKELNDNRVFPFDSGAVQISFSKLLKRVDLDQRDSVTNRFLIHSHSLRKFFRTELAQAIPLDVVEHLMGHSSYLSGSYRKYSEKELSEFYLKGVHKLQIYETGIPESKLDELKIESKAKIGYLEDRIKAYEDKLNDLMERTKWMSLATDKEKMEYRRKVERGEIPELPTPTAKEEKRILKERVK